MRYVCLLAGLAFLAGCVTLKTYTVEKPRTDTDVYGNRGYLSGEPKEEPEPKETRLGKTRKISVVEVEFGPERLEDDLEDAESVAYQEESSFSDEYDYEDEYSHLQIDEEVAYDAQELLPEKDQSQIQYYTVRKNDTLQKISYKFYGTTKKWNKLFEANRDVLKNPDKLYPGTRIKIPDLN
jgi:nucleoid-associated protein YgaU